MLLTGAFTRLKKNVDTMIRLKKLSLINHYISQKQLPSQFEIDSDSDCFEYNESRTTPTIRYQTVIQDKITDLMNCIVNKSPAPLSCGEAA